jgi:hypothetical protein
VVADDAHAKWDARLRALVARVRAARDWPANRAWTMSCSTTMASTWRPLDGSMDGRSDMLPPLDPPGCADRRTCNVNLDNLRCDRPDLNCEPQQTLGIARNLQLDETRAVKIASPVAVRSATCSLSIAALEASRFLVGDTSTAGVPA